MYIGEGNGHSFYIMELRVDESDNQWSANKLCNDTHTHNDKFHQKERLVWATYLDQMFQGGLSEQGLGQQLL